MRPEREYVWIIDNRDGTRGRAYGLGINVHYARADAYDCAVGECRERNAREGWDRFVAITWRAGKSLGFYPRCHIEVRRWPTVG